MTENSISPEERRRTRSITAPPHGVYFTALSRRLASAWAMNSRLPRTLQARRQLGLEIEALLLADRLVELGDVGGELAGIERRLVGRRAGGLQPGDGQHGGEGAQDAVGVLQRLGQGRLRIALAGLDVDQRHLQPRAQPGQRRAQVVGDGVAGVAQAGDRALQPVQHVVEAGGQLVELVAGAAQLRPARRRSPPRTAATTSFSRATERLTLRLTRRPPARPSTTTSAPAPTGRARSAAR